MRCPKCHYISFGSTDRCRNCGYECRLAVETPAGPYNLDAEWVVDAAGLASQRSSCVCWDRRDGRPLDRVPSFTVVRGRADRHRVAREIESGAPAGVGDEREARVHEIRVQVLERQEDRLPGRQHLSRDGARHAMRP